mgnify:CR=1 FL=1
MIVQFANWGNSLALRIPAAYAKAIGAAESGKAELSVEEGRLVLRPVADGPQYDLDAMTKDMLEKLGAKLKPVR